MMVCSSCGKAKANYSMYTADICTDCRRKPRGDIMKKVKGKVVFEYDFTEQIQMANDDRAADGEAEMTVAEITEFVADDLADFDFRATVGDIKNNITVTVEEVEE